jgi:hypothetical protein
MEQTRAAITAHLAERVCWQVARRDDSRVARRLYRKPVGDGVSPLDGGAVVDACVQCLEEREGLTWRQHARGTGVERERVPRVQDCPALRAEAPVWHRAQACLAGGARERRSQHARAGLLRLSPAYLHACPIQEVG